MRMERIPRRVPAGSLFQVLLAALMAWAPSEAREEAQGLDGEVEVLYRSVSVDGSENKFEEDFDGLDSGIRLGKMSLNWQNPAATYLDFARLNLTGLGGEPFEYASLDLGRKDSYDLKFVHRKQSYLYDLFPVTDDLDGHLWNTDNRTTAIDLSLYPGDRVEVMVGFEEGRRTGDSLFMKDVGAELYRMQTPIDREVRRYSAGVDVDAGPVQILLRQTLQRYDNQFNSMTTGDQGLDPGDGSFLSSYDWRQSQDGSADLTDIRITSSFGKRVGLAVSYFGTLFGEDTIEDRVRLDQDGEGFCSFGVCFPVTITGGYSQVDIVRNTDLIDVDLSVDIVTALALHLQYRSLNQEVESSGESELDGDGFAEPVDTRLDWSQESATALLDFRPLDSLGFHGGYRVIDRDLERSGYPDPSTLVPNTRDADYESKDDETFLIGFTWRPTRHFHLSGNYEDGKVEQPFTNVSFGDTEELRVRAAVRPTETIRIDLTYRDFESITVAGDFRPPPSSAPSLPDFDSRLDGQSWSATFSQQVSGRVDYLVGYTRQEMDNPAAILFDTAGFGPPFDTGGNETGESRFQLDSEFWQARVNVEFSAGWQAYAHFWMVESDGNDFFDGDVSGVISPGLIDQDYVDWEVGVTRRFASGLFVGGAVRGFDYQDENEVQDYDGLIVTARAGFRF